MSDNTQQHAQLLNASITVGIIVKGQNGRLRKEGIAGCGTEGRPTAECPGQGMCQVYQELSRACIYLGLLLALLWLLGLKDLPGGRSWHLLAFEWGGHIQRDFGYSIFHRVLDSGASEDTASPFRGR